MTIFAIRIFIFSVLPLLLAGLVIALDKTTSSRERRLEVLLIWFLAIARRAEAAPDSETRTAEFDNWRGALTQAVGFVTACVATAFGIGFAINQPVMITLFGTLIGCVIVVVILRRSPIHQVKVF